MQKINKKFLIVIFLFFVVIFLIYMWQRPQVTIFNAKKYGLNCQFMGSCGNIAHIDCGAEVDGPLYYVDKNTGEIIGYCGGYCMVKNSQYCQNCPPKQWDCK